MTSETTPGPEPEALPADAGTASSPAAPAATPPVAGVGVRSIVIHGCTIVIETKADGTVLVNGDPVEPVAVTLQRFRNES